MLKIRNVIIRLILLSVVLLSTCVCSGFLFSKNFTNKSEGKYSHFIEECKTLRNKDVKKAKAIEDTYKLKYENVIYENEVTKNDMLKMKNSKSVAEYVVCIYDEYDVSSKNGTEKIQEGSYYVYSITKEEFRKLLSEQLEDINKKNKGISQIVGAAVSGAATGAGTGVGLGAAAGTVTVPGLGTVAGAAVGGVVGGVSGAIGVGVKKAYDLYIEGEIDLDDYIKEWSDDEYVRTFTENIQYYSPKIKKIKYKELNQYLSKDDLKTADSLEKKYIKKK